MMISALLMILALAVGPGSSQSILSDSSTSSTAKAPTEPEDNCWVNGVWYNPCPGNSPWEPEPPPDLPPS